MFVSVFLIVFALASALGHTPCGEREITGLPDFDYDTLTQEDWVYDYMPRTWFYQSQIKSGEVITAKIDKNKYSAVVNFHLSDGSIDENFYEETYLGNGKVFERRLDEFGEPTNATHEVTVFAYKPLTYIQLFVCTNNFGVKGSPEMRYVLIPKGSSLSRTERREVARNDRKYRFRGRIYELNANRPLDEEF